MVREPSVAERMRLAVLLALADVPRDCGVCVRQIAERTPWPPARLYEPVAKLAKAGLVERHYLNGMYWVRLVEHPDLVHLNTSFVPDDRETAT